MSNNFDDYQQSNSFSGITNKYDKELYHEEDDIAFLCVRVKSFKNQNNGEKWKVYENSKIVLILEDKNYLSNEIKFLNTTNGFNFLIKNYKTAILDINKFNEILKINAA